MILPPWIDAEAWEEWVDMRKRIKKPLTDRAKIRAIGRLNDIRVAGYDPNESLIQSADFYWQDLYPTKDKVIEANPRLQADQTREMLQKWDKEREASRGSKIPENLLRMVKKA